MLKLLILRSSGSGSGSTIDGEGLQLQFTFAAGVTARRRSFCVTEILQASTKPTSPTTRLEDRQF
eukprot:scaffold19850_cov72-Skeletonema_dohrnii-CCMP3373.AAC.1